MIKKIAVTLVIVLFVCFGAAFAQDQHDHSKHGADMKGHEGHDMSAGKTQSKGKLLIEKKVQDYALSYYLLDMAERKVMMKGMEGMEMAGMSKSPDITNHLMIYIKGADNKEVSGKIGFIITGPDGKDVKTLTMGMYGGYGADVSFKAKGIYKIKTKATIKDKTVNDEISYEVK